jgi:hypothetical protein
MIEQSSWLHCGLNQNHTVEGITGVAVPITDAAQRPVAAISVSGTGRQFPGTAIPALLRSLRTQAETLARLLQVPGPEAGGKAHSPDALPAPGRPAGQPFRRSLIARLNVSNG